MRLTNALVSGIMCARNGGFAVAPYLIRKEAAARGVTPEKIDATIAAYFDVMAMVEIEIEAITGKVNRA